MAEKSFMTVEEVAAELRVSKSGRVNATFFHKKVCYSD